MENRLLMLKHGNPAGHQKYWKNLFFKPYSTIHLTTVLSDTHKILDISFTENSSSIKFSIKILGITNLLVPTSLCGVHKPKVEHSILSDMKALRSANPSLRKSSIDK